MSHTLSIDQLITKMVDNTDYTREEITKMINDTIESMDHMVTEEGAAYVVADNLGVSMDSDNTAEEYKIKDLIPGQSNIATAGRVAKKFPIRNFVRKDKTPGRVQNIELIDATGSIRMAFWDKKCELLESIQVGSIVSIRGASTKSGRDNDTELSLGMHGDIKVIADDGLEADFPKITHASTISIENINPSLKEVSITAKIVEMRNVVEFERDGRKGKVLNIILKDLTGSIQMTLWNEMVDKFMFQAGDNVHLTDLRVGVDTRSNEVQLTYNSYSTASIIDNNPELDKLKVSGESINNISELEDKMTNITVYGKISEISEPKVFEKNGEKRHLQNISLFDHKGAVRMTLWGEDTKLLSQFSVGDIIKLEGVRTRYNNFTNEVELNFSSNSTMQISSEKAGSHFELSTESIKLNDVSETKRGVTVKGKVTRIFETREIELKDGSQSRVKNINIVDASGAKGKVAAWDNNIAKIDDIVEDNVLIFQNVRVKPIEEYPPEILVGNSSQVILSNDEDFGPIMQTADTYMNTVYEKTQLSHLTEGARVKVKGSIVNIFNPTFYDGCNQCNRKVDTEAGSSTGICNEHGNVEKTVKIIITLNLDDTESTAILKFFNEKAERLIGMSAAEAKEKIERLSDQKAVTNDLMMEDYWVEGKVGSNPERGELYITVDKFGKLNYQEDTENTLNKYSGY